MPGTASSGAPRNAKGGSGEGAAMTTMDGRWSAADEAGLEGGTASIGVSPPATSSTGVVGSAGADDSTGAASGSVGAGGASTGGVDSMGGSLEATGVSASVPAGGVVSAGAGGATAPAVASSVVAGSEAPSSEPLVHATGSQSVSGAGSDASVGVAVEASSSADELPSADASRTLPDSACAVALKERAKSTAADVARTVAVRLTPLLPKASARRDYRSRPSRPQLSASTSFPFAGG